MNYGGKEIVELFPGPPPQVVARTRSVIDEWAGQ